MTIEQLFSDALAHAYILYRADVDGVISYIEKKNSVTFGANQNAVKYVAETISIDDSRAITTLGNLHAGGEMYIAISARTIGTEAQHALLKTIEEPRTGVHYFIFVDNPETLLPTLRSRSICVQKLSGNENKKAEKHPDFLAITLAERFAYVEKIAKNLKKDDPMAFRDAAISIFDAVIRDLRENITDDMQSQAEQLSRTEQLSRILELRNFLNDRGSSLKQLLETMAIQLG